MGPWLLIEGRYKEMYLEDEIHGSIMSEQCSNVVLKQTTDGT